MKRHGLKGVALTEHHRASLLERLNIEGKLIIPACEYKSKDYGEIIGLFVDRHIENRTFVEIAEDIKDNNGIVLLPHPRDPFRKHTAIRRGLPTEIIDKHVDLIEGINSRCLLPIFNQWAQDLAKKLGKPVTAGSDAHTFLEIGHAKTWLQDIETTDDVYEELMRGRTQITGRCSFFWVHLPSAIWQRLRRTAYDAW